MQAPPLSIVVPVLNEVAGLPNTLAALQSYRDAGCEIIVVDGGSSDASIDVASQQADLVISAKAGRAAQMNAGASQASGQMLMFLHADTRLPNNVDAILQQLRAEKLQWGFFPLALSGGALSFRVIEWFINHRSRWFSIATGDQALFCSRDTFNFLQGFTDIPLMEDIEFCKRAKRLAAPFILISSKVTTSSRRWEQRGVMPTVLLMWRLRLLYWLGVNPRRLALQYRSAAR